MKKPAAGILFLRCSTPLVYFVPLGHKPAYAVEP